MSPWAVTGAASAGVVFAGVTALVVPPVPRLAPRVRPYLVAVRASLRLAPDVRGMHLTGTGRRSRGAVAWLRGASRCAGRWIEQRNDDELRLRLLHAGMADLDLDAYRAGTFTRGVTGCVAGGALGAAVGSAPLGLGLALCGFVAGASRLRARVDREIARRRERIRLELATIDLLLAVHVRTGAGPMQAMQRVVTRGSGLVVEELEGTLSRIRAGTSEPVSLRRSARLTPEPSAARTYHLLALGAERGVDLAGALRALSEDVRDARRQEVRATATRRRAAMLVPTVAVLAPVMLLFVAAPLPSIVLGSR